MDEESIIPIPGLGDSEDSDDLFPSRTKQDLNKVKAAPNNKAKERKSDESHNINDSDDEYEEGSESEEDEIDELDENVEFTKDGGIINPKIN